MMLPPPPSMPRQVKYKPETCARACGRRAMRSVHVSALARMFTHQRDLEKHVCTTRCPSSSRASCTMCVRACTYSRLAGARSQHKEHKNCHQPKAKHVLDIFYAIRLPFVDVSRRATTQRSIQSSAKRTKRVPDSVSLNWIITHDDVDNGPDTGDDDDDDDDSIGQHSCVCACKRVQIARTMSSIQA